MFGLGYNKDSKEIIFPSMKNIKPLLHKFLSSKFFMLKISEEEASNGLIRTYKQVYMTHPVMTKYISSIKLL